MHEFGVAASVLEAVEARAAGRTVAGVRLQIGALQRLDRSVFDDAFAMVAGGGVADGASVDVVEVAARLECRTCERVHVVGGGPDPDPREIALVTTCEGCGGHDLELVAGDELVLESITLTGRDTPAAQPQEVG